MEDLSDARTIVVSARRRAPTKEQLAGLKTAIDRGVGVVAVRTACHAFSLAPRGNPQPDPPAGHAVWPDIDRELLGCDYRLHWNNKADDEPRTLLKVVSADDPLLAKWPREPAERPTRSWLYKARPLTDDCKLLISGRVPGRTADGEDEPVAWTRVRGKQRIFATTLGHPEELADEVFAELLRRGVMWTLGE